MKSFQQIWIHMESYEKQALASSVKSTKNYLSQIAYGHRNPSRILMRSLCNADPRLHPEMFL